jgi:hypothetical protein
MADQWKFDVQGVRDPQIVDGKIEIKLDVEAHPASARGQLHLMFDKEAAGNLGGRLVALLRLPQLR